jgi:hypothetical protein
LQENHFLCQKFLNYFPLHDLLNWDLYFVKRPLLLDPANIVIWTSSNTTCINFCFLREQIQISTGKYKPLDCG